MKKRPKTMPVTSTREVYPWILLWNRCCWAIEDAAVSKDREYLYMYSMILAAFTMEAFLNHLLKFRRPNGWEEFERKAAPAQKLRTLCSELGLEPDKGHRPFSTFGAIFRFRNDLAHAKPITLSHTFKYPIHEFLQAKELPVFPLTPWEKSLTPATARKFHADTRDMILALYAAADMGDRPFDETYSRLTWKGTL